MNNCNNVNNTVTLNILVTVIPGKHQVWAKNNWTFVQTTEKHAPQSKFVSGLLLHCHSSCWPPHGSCFWLLRSNTSTWARIVSDTCLSQTVQHRQSHFSVQLLEKAALMNQSERKDRDLLQLFFPFGASSRGLPPACIYQQHQQKGIQSSFSYSAGIRMNLEFLALLL